MAFYENGQNLRQLYESHGAVATLGKLSNLLESGQVKADEFSFKELAIAFCGYDWYRRLNKGNGPQHQSVRVQEAGEGVDVSAFGDITGQLLYTKIMDGWKQVVSVAESFVDTISSELAGERFPWLSHIYDAGFAVKAGMPYPEVQFGERYIDTPVTEKFGSIVSVTKEMIFFDRTKQVFNQCGEVGGNLGYLKANRIYDCVFGFTNNYKLNGTNYNTFLTSGTNYINSASGTPLVDYTSINQAYVLKANLLDPDTGRPIQFELRDLFCSPQKEMDARRIVASTEYRTTYPAFSATGVNPPGNVQNVGPNPIPDKFRPFSDAIGYQRLLYNGVSATAANDVWLVGDFKKAFWYIQNWPITVEQAPPNSIKEFEQDIVHRTKASEMGAAAVVEPRAAMLFFNAAL